MRHRWSSLFAGRVSHLHQKRVYVRGTMCYTPVCLDLMRLNSILIQLLYSGNLYLGVDHGKSATARESTSLLVRDELLANVLGVSLQNLPVLPPVICGHV